MNDNDIIKALECCKEKNCTKCPAFDENIDCGENTIQLALDLINRQQAEIERYKGVIKRLENDVKEAQAELKEFKALYVSKVAEMGIKAFAKRLKSVSCEIEIGGKYRYKVATHQSIDNLVKEMTESVNYGSSKTEGHQ